MRFYLSFDDTDIAGAPIGTGRLARMFTEHIPSDFKLWGVLRHQQLVAEGIPYTSQNSSACMVIDAPEGATRSDLEPLLESAVQHVLRYCSVGSDPGVCLATEADDMAPLITFGKACTNERKTQAQAMEAASHVTLLGLGGTNDGIIGAAAAIGLTAYGWCGRFIQFANLRSFEDTVRVADLENVGVRVLSVDRNATVPAPGDSVFTYGWLRPQLWSQAPVLPVQGNGDGSWVTAHKKNKPTKKQP